MFCACFAVLQFVRVRCRVSQCVAVCCAFANVFYTLQLSHCNTLQHTAKHSTTHCNTLPNAPIIKIYTSQDLNNNVARHENKRRLLFSWKKKLIHQCIDKLKYRCMTNSMSREVVKRKLEACVCHTSMTHRWYIGDAFSLCYIHNLSSSWAQFIEFVITIYRVREHVRARNFTQRGREKRHTSSRYIDDSLTMWYINDAFGLWYMTMYWVREHVPVRDT